MDIIAFNEALHRLINQLLLNEIFGFLDDMDTFNETLHLSILESEVILGNAHSIYEQVVRSTS